jgi:hypothetical protein
MSRIHRREDVNPEEGKREYGDVEFADPVNNKYPVDSEKHVRAAWSYIHQERNADEYSEEDQKKIKNNIRRAAEKFGVELNEND